MQVGARRSGANELSRKKCVYQLGRRIPVLHQTSETRKTCANCSRGASRMHRVAMCAQTRQKRVAKQEHAGGDDNTRI